MTGDRVIPAATVGRLPTYLRVLVELADDGVPTVSSELLAERTGTNSAKVRKDLSHLGSRGTRGVGYDTDGLLRHVARVLGLTDEWATAIVGVGNLGQALAGYGGFADRGFRITALIDVDAALVGRTIAGVEVTHLDDCEATVAEHGISIAVLAVPDRVAQETADRLVAAGVTSLLSFAPGVVTVPDHVSVRGVDLSSELQILSFYEQRRAAHRALADGVVPHEAAS